MGKKTKKNWIIIKQKIEKGIEVEIEIKNEKKETITKKINLL